MHSRERQQQRGLGSSRERKRIGETIEYLVAQQQICINRGVMCIVLSSVLDGRREDNIG